MNAPVDISNVMNGLLDVFESSLGKKVGMR